MFGFHENLREKKKKKNKIKEKKIKKYKIDLKLINYFLYLISFICL